MFWCRVSLQRKTSHHCLLPSDEQRAGLRHGSLWFWGCRTFHVSCFFCSITGHLPSVHLLWGHSSHAASPLCPSSFHVSMATVDFIIDFTIWPLCRYCYGLLLLQWNVLLLLLPLFIIILLLLHPLDLKLPQLRPGLCLFGPYTLMVPLEQVD